MTFRAAAAAEKHDFIPSSKSLHPLETCDVCGTDPRNAIHLGAEAAVREKLAGLNTVLIRHGAFGQEALTWCGVTFEPTDLRFSPPFPRRPKEHGVNCEACVIKALDFYPIVGKVPEKVEHPSHYGGADNPYETIKVLEAWLTPEELRGFLKGNAIKYLSRAGKKQGESALDDFKKAEWYSKRATALEGKR